MFKKVFTVFPLIVMLMVSTMGINLHKLYCICVDKTKVSLFEIDKECGLDEPVCTKHACCKKPESNSKKPCTEKKSSFYKIGSQFEKPGEITFPSFVFIEPVQAFSFYFKKEYQPLSNIQLDLPFPKGPPTFLKNCVFRC
jgi:hypothetical protein